jgi:hypothetical protein
MRTIMLLALAVGLFAVTTGYAGGKVRWHINPDQSVLLDDDNHGQRLVLPSEYQEAQISAGEHYGEVNPDSFTDHGMNSYGKHSFEITFDIAPSHILSQAELEAWINEEGSKAGKEWWWYDLLLISYRNLENKAKAISAQDPEREQQELTKKRETAKITEPSAAMIKRLYSHGIQYSGKVYTNGGERDWRFAIKDPNSAREIDFPVPAGSSEAAVIKQAYQSTSGDGVFSGSWARQFVH